jgi:hypothetical protein
VLVLPEHDFGFGRFSHVEPVVVPLFVDVLLRIHQLAEPVDLDSFVELHLAVHAPELDKGYYALLPIQMLVIEYLDLVNYFQSITIDGFLNLQIFGHILWIGDHLMLKSFLLFIEIL